MDKKNFTDAIAQHPSAEVLSTWMEAASYHDCLSSELKEPLDLEHPTTKLKQLLGLRKTDVIVPTSSSSEGVTHVYHGIYHDVVRKFGKNQIIYLEGDEAPIQLGIKQLDIHHVVGRGIDAPRLTRELLEEAITPRTALVSLSWADGLSGVVQPLVDIATVCEEKGVLLHVDVTTAIGKQYISLADLPIDYITIDGSRIGAPAGTGLLIMQRGSIVPPLLPDVLQHDGHRGGMFNYPGYMACIKALEEKEELIDHTCLEGVRLRDLFQETITVPKKILFESFERLPTTTAISFPEVHPALMLHALHERGVVATRGGGIYPELPSNALSFTLPKYADETFVKEAATIINETYEFLAKGAIV